MDQLAKSKRKIQELIAVNDFAGVFEALKSILPAESKAYQNLLLLEARLNEANVNRIKGIVRDEELQVTYASIRNDLLSLVNSLSPADLDPDQSFSNLDQSGKAKQGQVLYQIPATMRLNEESKCIVRIALNEALLVKNLALIDKTEIKDIRISDLMQVELLDNNKQTPFAIRSVSRKEQFIDKDDYTEWIFYVEPQKEGVYPITIKVAVIEMVHGKEAYREIVLEEQVEIVTTQPASDIEPEFKPAAYNFGFNSQDVQVNYEGSSSGSNWRRTLAMSLAFLLGFNAITWAAAPADYEWIATRYLLNSEDGYQNYIERWEEKEKDQHVESAYFRKAEVTQDTNNYEVYLQKYPVNEAGQPLGKYTEEATFKVAGLKQSQEAYQQYLDYFEERGNERFQEEATFMIAKLSNSPLAFKKYFDKYGATGLYTAESNTMLEEQGLVMLETAKRDSNLLEVQTLLSITPNLEVRQEANEILEAVPQEVQDSLVVELEELTIENVQEEDTRSSDLRSDENVEEPKLDIKPATPATSITDIDGNTYTTAIMADGRRWMTQNLNVEIEDSYCYDDDPANCQKYGRLYEWEAAKRACAALGDGWQLPTDEEWQNMIAQYGGLQGESKAIYLNLVKGGESKFDALLGGYRFPNGGFSTLNNYGGYWSAMGFNGGNARDINFDPLKSEVYRSLDEKQVGRSCRCIQGEDSSSPNSDRGQSEGEKNTLTSTPNIKPATPTASITDKDGNSYTTAIMADGRRWMTENLNAGESILCYDNNPSNCKKYGRLYTWEAAKNACASFGNGWTLPTNEEWEQLVRQYGGLYEKGENDGSASYKALIKGGSSNFNALLGGLAVSPIKEQNLNKIGYYWTATNGKNNLHAWIYVFTKAKSKLSRSNEFNAIKGLGRSCRCIQGKATKGNQPKNKVEEKTTNNTPKENELSLDIKPATPATSITDKDGNSYTTAIMADGKRWMTQNLNLKVDKSYCYDDDPSNCKEYGRLYTWETAKKACSALGDGWHLPFKDEWERLIYKYGDFNDYHHNDGKEAYLTIKKLSTKGILGGSSNGNNKYSNIGKLGNYWINKSNGIDAWYIRLKADEQSVYLGDAFNKRGAISCRCVQD